MIELANGDYTLLSLEINNGKYYIVATGDGYALLEISKATYDMILHDKEWGVD